MTETSIERAARALYQTGDFDPHQFGEDQVWPDLVPYVTTVIESIREPSELQGHTVSRILEKRGEYCYQSPSWIWKTMIDVLIKGVEAKIASDIRGEIRA